MRSTYRTPNKCFMSNGKRGRCYKGNSFTSISIFSFRPMGRVTANRKKVIAAGGGRLCSQLYLCHARNVAGGPSLLRRRRNN